MRKGDLVAAVALVLVAAASTATYFSLNWPSEPELPPPLQYVRAVVLHQSELRKLESLERALEEITHAKKDAEHRGNLLVDSAAGVAEARSSKARRAAEIDPDVRSELDATLNKIRTDAVRDAITGTSLSLKAIEIDAKLIPQIERDIEQQRKVVEAARIAAEPPTP